MKIPGWFLIATLLAWSAQSFADQTILMVSIDKIGVSSKDVQNAIAKLNHKDPSMGTCYVDSTVTEYIDYSKFDKAAPYYGVAIVDFKWQCDNHAKGYLTKLVQSRKYTIWANSVIGPWPAVSGSN